MEWGIELYVFAIIAVILIIIIHLRYVFTTNGIWNIDPHDLLEHRYAKWKEVEGFVASAATTAMDDNSATIAGQVQSQTSWHVGQLDQRLQQILANEEPKTYTFVAGNKQFILHSAIREAIAKLRSTTATQLTSSEMDTLLAPIVAAYRAVDKSDSEIDDILGFPATTGTTPDAVNNMATTLRKSLQITST